MLTQTEFTRSKTVSQHTSFPFCHCFYSMLEGFLTSAWVKQEPQGDIKQVPHGSRARVHARHALKSHCSERMWFREVCVWQVEGHQQHVGQVSPTAASDVCLKQADPRQSLPSSPSHSCTSRFWACSPHGPGSSKAHTQQQLPRAGASSPATTSVALSFPLNAHWTSFPTRQTRPMCIHLSRTSDLKWRCSLAATITLTIYSAEANHESRAGFQIWKNS